MKHSDADKKKGLRRRALNPIWDQYEEWSQLSEIEAGDNVNKKT